MIEDASGSIEYDETGDGPTVVLVPGSCSTGLAWKAVVNALKGGFRCVTTSLLGYGRTAERRTSGDTSISHEIASVVTVIRAAGCPVTLVGHSFGALVSLGVALRKAVPLNSLVIIEAPAAELLNTPKDDQHYRAFRDMTESYFREWNGGNQEAVALMIDFYGGNGTYASWPTRVRAYAVETTPVNMLDWTSAYEFPLSAASLASIDVPVLVICGSESHPAVQRANALLSASVRRSSLHTISGAAHFAISTHPTEIARLVAQHVPRPIQQAPTTSVRML